MKSYSLLIVICLIFASFSIGQNSLQWLNRFVYSSREIQSDFIRRLDFVGPVKSLDYHYRPSYGDSLSEKFTFSENGILLTYTKRNSKGEVLCEAIFSGDICTYYKEDFANGRDIRIIKKNLSGQNIEVQESNTITTFLYDSLGRLLERKMNHGNGLRIDKTTLTYFPENKLVIKEYDNNTLSNEEHYIDTNLVKSISYSSSKTKNVDYEYNQSGKITMKYSFELASGVEKLLSKTTYVYKDGKLMKEIYISPEREFPLETIYTYNELGLLIKIYSRDEGEIITTFEYDSNRNLILEKKEQVQGEERTIVYENKEFNEQPDLETNDNSGTNWKVVYNDSGQPISNIHYWKGRIQDKETFEYHSNGKLKSHRIENYNSDETLTSYSYKEFNEQGVLMSSERLSADGNMQRYSRPEPVLDSQGNWIINYFGGYPSEENQFRVYRDIIYY